MPGHDNRNSTNIRRFGDAIGDAGDPAAIDGRPDNPYEPPDVDELLSVDNPQQDQNRFDFEAETQVSDASRRDLILTPEDFDRLPREGLTGAGRGFPGAKGRLIYDNQQSYGAGASTREESTPFGPDFRDKIRWQSEALWPAYYTEGSVPTRPPEFVKRGAAELGNPSGPFRYAGPAVHQLIFRKEEYNPETEFGEYNELVDLYVDIDHLIENYSDRYSITKEEFENIADGAPARDIVRLNEFVKALKELYGVYVRPLTLLEAREEERFVQDAGNPEQEAEDARRRAADALFPVAEEENLVRAITAVVADVNNEGIRDGYVHRRELDEAGNTTGLTLPADLELSYRITTSDFERAEIVFYTVNGNTYRQFLEQQAPLYDPDLQYKAQVLLYRAEQEAWPDPQSPRNDWLRGIVRIWTRGEDGAYIPPPMEYDIGIPVRPELFNEFPIPDPNNVGPRHGIARNRAVEFGGRVFSMLIERSPWPLFSMADGRPEQAPSPFDALGEIDRDQFFRTAAGGTIAEQEFIEGIFQRYMDHTTLVPGLLNQRQAERIGIDSSTGLVKPVYNYLLLDYERILESKLKPFSATHAIPNIYVLTRESVNEESILVDPDTPRARELQADFKNFSTVGGLIESVRPRLAPGPGNVGKTYSNRQYFSSWTAAIDKVLPFVEGNPDLEIQRNIDLFRKAQRNFRYLIVPPEELGFIREANENREIYPMYNEIRFTLSPNKAFANILSRFHLTNLFAKAATRSEFQLFNVYGRELDSADRPNWFNTNSELNSQEFRTLDVLNYWRRFDEPSELAALETELQNDPDLIMLGANVERQFLVREPELQQPLIRIGFYNTMREIIKSSLRPYRTMLNGYRAVSQALFYRVEKRLNEQVVQEFFVPNTPEASVFEYIDTQVMYGRTPDTNEYNKYNYKIYACQLVVGNDYRRGVHAKPGKFRPEEWNFPSRPLLEPHTRRRLEAEGMEIGIPEPILYSAELDEAAFRLERDRQVSAGPDALDRPGLAPLDAAPGDVPFELGELREADNVGDVLSPAEQRRAQLIAEGEARLLKWSRDERRIDQLDIEIGYFNDSGERTVVNDHPDMFLEALARAHRAGFTRKVRIGLLCNNKPSVKMVQVPIFESSDVHVFDKPPATPDVNFTPYRAIDNQLLVTMNEQANTHVKQEPIPFGFGEGRDIRLTMQSQFLNGEIEILPGTPLDEVEIVYGNDDLPAEFLVYRLDTPPNSYQDFASALYHIADLADGTDTPKASSAALKDALVPNRKYYYTFRVRDVHGHLSNPTVVYQTQLVNNGGAIYLLLDVYDFPDAEAVSFTKGLQQYIMIKPSLSQGVVNSALSGLVTENGDPTFTAKFKDIHLGPEEEVVWGKKLKFRLVSKKTGRKLDINVDFQIDQETDAGHLPVFFDATPTLLGE